MTSRGQIFLDRLHGEILLGDGGFGTRLYDLGIGLEVSYEQLNLTRPDLVEKVSSEYVAAGSHLIETNSFCANVHKQRRFGLEREVPKMARAAAELSRRVAGPDRFVAGSLGPLARRRRELDEYTEDDMKRMYREPMQALLEGGADLILLETFTLLTDLELALGVALEFKVPVICEMAFGEEGTTEVGVTPERAARKLTELGAHVVGANCRSGPLILADVLERQGHATALPLSVFPNAGYAQQIDGRYVYQASPQYFAEQAPHLVAMGAHLIGGCCGTTPQHIRALAEAVRGLKPSAKRVVVSGPVTEPPRPNPARAGMAFRDLLSKATRFVTVEIEPPKGSEFKKTLEGARTVVKAGCDALNVPDNALAKVRMDNVIYADLLRQHVDVPVILHLTCRDKNMIALQADLLGAQMVGIEAILAVTGDPASIGDQPGASSVYDINSIGLVEMIQSLNQGVTASGTILQEPTNFAIGVALNANVRGERGWKGRSSSSSARSGPARTLWKRSRFTIRIFSGSFCRRRKLSKFRSVWGSCRF